MNASNQLRNAVLVGLACVALVAQAVVFRYISVEGVVPNLVLLVVVAAAIARGPQLASGLGFVAGLLLDLAPPADHVAGRWALALVIVGYLAGRVREDARQSQLMTVGLVAAMSFVGTSIYALTGAVFSDGALAVDSTLRVILISILWDVMLAPFVLPPLVWVADRLAPEHLRAEPGYRAR